ncbi:MAG TPA: hypothetical protein VKP69_14760, partial [Isosphaeraceae bacterium]|nr:hypothetical protein [Isosphaeraceae bacterium]
GMSHLLGTYPPRLQIPAIKIQFLSLLLLTPPAYSQVGQACVPPPRPYPDYWFVHTRACPQVMGTDPRPFLQASWLDSRGCLAMRDPADLAAMAIGRPVIFLVHGSYYSADRAVTEGLRIHDAFVTLQAIPPDAVVVAFDWPTEVVYANPVRDANEQGRRAFVAGYHLARFLQEFPPGSRVSLIGHSHGGLAVLSALHLLGGGTLDTGDACAAYRLPDLLPGIRLRAVVIVPGCDRHWLDPGQRLDRALVASEGILCLFNRLDPAPVLHPFGRYSDHRQALGRTGLSRLDEARLGPVAARYCEQTIAPLVGVRHTFLGTVETMPAAWWMAPYLLTFRTSV